MGSTLRRFIAALAVTLLALAGVATTSALAAHHHRGHRAAANGDANKGDVWVDTVGAPAGPGHEMDPQLPCANINLWGAKLADSSGTYTIDGWPPSGKQQTAYSSTWSYNPALADPQIISVINVQTLIANAVANGDKPAAHGFHFKLQFSQDPQKHKTFWINCTPAGTPPPGTPPPIQTQGPGPNTTNNASGVNGTAPSSAQGVLGNTVTKKAAKKKKHKKHHLAVRHPRFAG